MEIPVKISRVGIRCGVTIAALLALAASASAQRQMEKLGRGVVAINQGEGKVFVSWRLLGTEPESIAFNVYRATGAARPVKLNDAPLTKATCFQDTGVSFSQPVSYTVGRSSRPGTARRQGVQVPGQRPGQAIHSDSAQGRPDAQ